MVETIVAQSVDENTLEGIQRSNDQLLKKKQNSPNDVYIYQDLSEPALTAHMNFWNEKLDDETSIEHLKLNVGESFTIMSPANYTSGFEWSTYCSIPNIVKVESKFNADEMIQNGESGKEITTFTGMKQGVVRVSRLYLRTWNENSVQNSRSFIITVKNRPVNPETDI